MDIKPPSASQQLQSLRLQYLERATFQIEMLQEEVYHLEIQLDQIDKIRNISNACAEIMKMANRICYESLANILQELD